MPHRPPDRLPGSRPACDRGRDLETIAAGFDIGPVIGPIEPLGKGLINDTFRLAAGSGRYVLQRVNAQVFPRPEQIMANLDVLAAHAAGAEGLRVPALIRARDGRSFLRTDAGEVWRLMELIPDAVNLPRIEISSQAQEVGAALGRFHRLTRDLAPERLGLSLPGFHQTPNYLARHLAVRREASTGEGPEIQGLFGCIDARRGLAGVLERALAAGRIRLRVIHGDPKLDNILFHREDGRALALIDLDTVQPGLIQHDIGDCLRSCCNRRGESTDGAGGVRFDLDLCADILAAYGAETRDFLEEGDIEVLYDSIRLMPFELGLRFLTDHLEGDRYFRVSHRGENLRKAGIQFALLEDIEDHEREIRAIIAQAFPGAAGRHQP